MLESEDAEATKASLSGLEHMLYVYLDKLRSL